MARRRFFFFLFLITSCIIPRQLSGDAVFDGQPVTGATVDPGQANVVLLRFSVSVSSDEACVISGITVTYTGDATADITAGSVSLFMGGSPLANASFSGTEVSFTGLSVSCDSTTPREFSVSASISDSATGGHRVSAALASPENVAVSGSPVSGSFPIESLSSPHVISTPSSPVPAGISLDPAQLPASITAGAPFSVTVSVLDNDGNLYPGWSGAPAAVEGVTGCLPGYAPDGTRPVYHNGTSWSGGRTTCSFIPYKAETNRKISVSVAGLAGPDDMGSFSVAAGALAAYGISGQTSVALKTNTTCTLTAMDAWGNTAAGYNGTARISVSDAQAVCPPSVQFANGMASFSVMFRTWGQKEIVIRCDDNDSISVPLSITVAQSPVATHFRFDAPASVDRDKGFRAGITACNDDGEVVANYNEEVTLSAPPPASIRPGRVRLAGGAWEGDLVITGDMLQTRITVSDGEITTESAGNMFVGVSDYQKARAFPTVFTPADGPVSIRYFLREDREVSIRIYNTVMDMVREMRFPAGGEGGRQGLNVVEWNGKGGDGGSTGHSGGYHILIDKGYEKEWTGAVIKNH